MTKQKIEQFIKIFKIPPQISSYLDCIVSIEEIELVLLLDKKKLNTKEISLKMNKPLAKTEKFLKKAYERHVVNKLINGKKVGYVFDYVVEKGKEVKYMPANFHSRLESITMEEGWSEDVPKRVQKQISEWWVKSYANNVKEIVDEIKKDPDAYRQIKNKDFLLLDEALEQVRAAKVHAVLNCDCRCAEKACNFMQEACIRLDEGALYSLKRGLGRKISKKECLEIVIKANREGLMQTGTRKWRGKKLFGFCNCCTCCCNPIRATKYLNSEKIYPRTNYVAERDTRKCTNCGICTKRCQFNAFYFDKNKKLRFNKKKCYGCGVCATGCPVGAIKMLPLENENNKSK